MLVEKHKESLIVQRALLLFLHNFKNDQLLELKSKSKEFVSAFKKLEDRLRLENNNTEASYLTIDFTEFWRMFSTEISYKTQALIIDSSFKWYGKQAAADINFSINLEKQFKGMKQREVIVESRPLTDEEEKNTNWDKLKND